MEPDFSGWATKAGLKCADGRTIMPNAFQHQDTTQVPLVWSHDHDDPTNVLGHAVLENRPEGVYVYGYFNDTPKGKHAKQMVEHKDVTSMSIFANQLVEKSKQVLHGMIREVSLVLAGANPGALIDYVRIAHSFDDEYDVSEDAAKIFTGLELEHTAMSEESENDDSEETDDQTDNSEETEEVVEHADQSDDDDDNETVIEIYNTLTDKQKVVVDYLVEAAAEGAAEDNSVEHSDDSSDDDEEGDLTHQEGSDEMGRNVFDQTEEVSGKVKGKTLTHSQLQTIFNDAQKPGSSLKESFLAHAQEYGIEDIDYLFPDAKADGNGITLLSRRMEWVSGVLNGVKHSPFSRVKSTSADLTADEARAKGYVKGNLKKDEVIKLLKRVTTPKTIYKKQKLDRDDIVDITDLDIVAWLKAEMRVMLDEEIARAILVGDNRPADDEDKIDEDHIRPIAYDVDMYNTTVELAADISGDDLVDAFVQNMSKYKGSGNPVMYTTTAVYTDLILAKDTLGRRLYATKQELAAAMLVSDIVPVEAMEQDSDLVAVVVNLSDYTVGADQGGAVSMFDDFDIDYNQQKYLIETRISGALTRPKSAITFKKNSGRIVTPTAPTFDTETGVLTIPSQTGVVYQDADTGVTFSSGAQTAIAPGATVEVEAVPANGYGFTHNSVTDWAFTRDSE